MRGRSPTSSRAAVADEALRPPALSPSRYAGIADELAGRMPLAYTHLVQLLVDALVLAAPFALAAEFGPVSTVAGTALLTLFYSAVLDLAKMCALRRRPRRARARATSPSFFPRRAPS